MAKSWKPTEKDVVPIHPLSLLSKLVQTLGILHATIKDAFQKLGFVTEMMIALTIPMKIKIAPLLPVPVRISDAPPEDVFPIHSVVMVTMTAETDLVSLSILFLLRLQYLHHNSSYNSFQEFASLLQSVQYG